MYCLKFFEAFPKINKGYSHAYGGDELTKHTQKLFQSHFGDHIKVFFCFNGTAANVLSLQACTKSYNSVICTEDSHINVDECGAPEKIAGVKLIAVPSPDGKLKPEQIEEQMIRGGDQHYSQVKVVTITQPTELGTCYSLEEMKAIKEVCSKHKLFLHVDGSRLVNAAAHLNATLKEITTECGVDILSLGGTKNGLLGAEAVVIFNDELKHDFKFIRKQSLQLPSKMRFISVQFFVWLSDNLWLNNAKHALDMAQYFKQQITTTPAELTQAVQSNALFPSLKKEWVKPLKEQSFFYVWDEKKTIARLMTSYDTEKIWIDNFIKKINELSIER